MNACVPIAPIFGATAGCSTNIAATCSGTLDAFSFNADWRITKRFDAYAGAMYSQTVNGLASGFLHNNNIDPTIGLRYSW